MKLKVDVERAPADGREAALADPLQHVAEGQAIVIGQRVQPVERLHAREDAGGGHGRGEARALLVRPSDHLDRSAGCDAGVFKRAHDLPPGENAENAVEAAAGGRCVEMVADHDGRKILLSLQPREHLSGLVDH